MEQIVKYDIFFRGYKLLDEDYLCCLATWLFESAMAPHIIWFTLHPEVHIFLIPAIAMAYA